jgi:hypothetical protein
MDSRKKEAKLVGVRERVLNNNLNIDNVDELEKAKIRNICMDLMEWCKKIPDLEICAFDKSRYTLLSIMGWNDDLSMPDFCKKFHNEDDRKYESITDSIINPTTGEVKIFVKKENVKTHASEPIRERVRLKPILDHDPRDDDYYMNRHRPPSPHRRRPYIPK